MSKRHVLMPTPMMDLIVDQLDEAFTLHKLWEAADPEAEIIYGTSLDESLGDSLLITLIATGFDERPDAYSDYGFGDSYQPPASQSGYSQQQQRTTPPPAGGGAPQQGYQGQQPQGDYAGDDWESESSIIRFLRER